MNKHEIHCFIAIKSIIYSIEQWPEIFVVFLSVSKFHLKSHSSSFVCWKPHIRMLKCGQTDKTMARVFHYLFHINQKQKITKVWKHLQDQVQPSVWHISSSISQFGPPHNSFLVLQQLHCSSPHTLKQFRILLEAGGSKLITVLKIQSPQYWKQKINHCSCLVAHTISGASQAAICLLDHLATWPVHVQLSTNTLVCLSQGDSLSATLPKAYITSWGYDSGTGPSTYLHSVSHACMWPVSPSICKAFQPSSTSTVQPNLLLRVYTIPSSSPLIKAVNKTDPKTELWGIQLVSWCQMDLTPFTVA